jgi:uncharacterized protein YndB with AHSA1/START domain
VTIEVARPLDEVWAVVSDYTRLPEWLEEFEAVVKESPGPVGVGTVFRYTIAPGHRSSTVELTEWDPPHRSAWDGPPLRSRGGGARPRGFTELRALDEGTTRVLTRYHPELSGTLVLWAPLVRRWLRRQRPADARRLKALIEQGA